MTSWRDSIHRLLKPEARVNRTVAQRIGQDLGSAIETGELDVNVLSALMSSPSEAAWTAAVSALRSLDGPVEPKSFVSFLGHQCQDVQLAVLSCLGGAQIDDVEFISRAAKFVNHKEYKFRRCARIGLSELCLWEANDVLRHVVESPGDDLSFSIAVNFMFSPLCARNEFLVNFVVAQFFVIGVCRSRLKGTVESDMLPLAEQAKATWSPEFDTEL